MRKSQIALYGATLVLLACLVAPVPVLAWKGQPAYAWSVDARLRVRFDPAEMEKRLAAIRMVPPPERGASVVDGSKNPELLLPSELFSELLKRGFDENLDARKAWRDRLEPVASDLGIGPELWPTLAEVAADLIPPASTSGEKPSWEEHCQASFEALAAARKAFGEKSFDRMLYEAVAPGLKVSSNGFGPDLEKQLRDLEDGCRKNSAAPGLF